MGQYGTRQNLSSMTAPGPCYSAVLWLLVYKYKGIRQDAITWKQPEQGRAAAIARCWERYLERLVNQGVRSQSRTGRWSGRCGTSAPCRHGAWLRTRHGRGGIPSESRTRGAAGGLAIPAGCRCYTDALHDGRCAVAHEQSRTDHGFRHSGAETAVCPEWRLLKDHFPSNHSVSQRLIDGPGSRCAQELGITAPGVKKGTEGLSCDQSASFFRGLPRVICPGLIPYLDSICSRNRSSPTGWQ